MNQKGKKWEEALRRGYIKVLSTFSKVVGFLGVKPKSWRSQLSAAGGTGVG